MNNAKVRPASLLTEEQEYVSRSKELPRAEKIQSVDDGSLIDPVFGRVEEGGTNYRNLGWLQASVLLMKTQVGIGALGIPLTFGTLGMIPGVLILTIIGGMTTWSDLMVGYFKLNHPEVHCIDDVGAILFGKIGRRIFMAAFQLYFLFVAGSAFITVSTALNALSDHATCTAVFVVVVAIAAWVLSSIRTFSRISWLAWVGVFCILTSLLILVIAVSLQDRPSTAPKDGPWQSDWVYFASPTFGEAMSAVATIVFSFSGTPGFFPIIAEMRNPRDSAKAILLCQAVVYSIYLITGVAVYHACGTYVASPALGSAGPLFKKICYGVALPGVTVSSILICHVPAKNIFVTLLRQSRHLTANTPTHWIYWLSCTFGVSLVGYIIASAIPGFGALVSLVGALLGTIMAFQPYGAMWIYDHRHPEHTSREAYTKWVLRFSWAVLIIVVGSFLTVAGTYGAVLDVISVYTGVNGGSPWSCKDNSS